MSARSVRKKDASSAPLVGRRRPGESAVARGLAASAASRGRTERVVGIAAGVAIVTYLAAAVVNRWGADWEPQPLDAERDRRSSPTDD